MYYKKLCELHPNFETYYKRWVLDDKNNIQFYPERFNQQYNIFRLVRATKRIRCVTKNTKTK